MKEALKLALDLAIMHHSDDGYAELRSKVRQLAKEALAQPEQEPGSICYKHDEPKRGCSWCDKHLPKRPWVGLTDEFCITNMFDMGHYSLQIVFKSRKNADEFKAALKEKNT